MQQQNQYQILADSLQAAAKLLNLQGTQLNRDVIALKNYLANPNFQVAVFGSFNYGKSTLLNAMLGNRSLPIDLIPTTGAAITVKYGSKLQSRIIFLDGTEICQDDTEILKQFAILSDDRRMRQDVASVEVFCPDPFLQTGVEFLDLPGTNDREEQDNLVRDRLLGADLVIQLLDARKLMTLGERENLRDWLCDRGIKTVIFVANFINLLEPEEQKQVQNRLRFVAESFRAELPPGFSNLYRVDALSALRARLKGDSAATNSSGLTTFATALQNIVGILQQNRGNIWLPRLQAIALQIQPLLKDKIDLHTSEIQSFEQKYYGKIAIKQKAEKLIKQGFANSVSQLKDWLNLSNLLAKYQSELAVKLAENNFKFWENYFKKDLEELQIAVRKWLDQAYDFFQEEQPEDLLISFPSKPQIELPPKPSNANNVNEPGVIAAGAGIGWLLGGPLGAAVIGGISYILNNNIQPDEKLSTESYEEQIAKICVDTAKNYLAIFSNKALSTLAEYEHKAEKIIYFQAKKQPLEITQQREDLHQWQNSFNQLLQELKNANISSIYQPYIQVKINNDVQKYSDSKKVESPTFKRQQNIEAQFIAWELDEEIAQIKAEMPSGKQQSTQSQKNNKIAQAYTFLGLQPNACLVEVKQAYRAFVKKWHPDLFVNQTQVQRQYAQDKFHLANEAYETLYNHLKSS